MKKLTFTSLLCSLAILHCGYGQLSFTNQANLIEDCYSTISVMTQDMNNDQQDDLILLENGNQIVVHLNNALQRSWKKIAGPVVGYSWAGVIGDFNNDGMKEIVTGSQNSPFRIYTFNHIDESFSLYYQHDATFFIQNMSTADFNADGWLDLFVCNDDGLNTLMINDGSGNLLSDDLIDFATTPESDNSGNYGSVVLDYDHDGDQDLYISKCRSFAALPTDPRRINQFFINDGNGNYEDKAAEFGLAFGQQTWVTDFADLDNDGDNDMIVANHFDDLILLENIDNESFVERQIGSGIALQGSFWQLSTIDFDNDGFQDFLVTATDLTIYRNNGDFTFTPLELSSSLVPFNIFTATIGDYNNDGFFDLSTGYGDLTETGDYVDSIWLNDGNSNHFVELVLEGSSTNRDAIGAYARCYTPEKELVYHIKGGHSYGIMNSTTIHFGLGAETSIDSIAIFWPDGSKELLENLEVDHKYYHKQLSCTLPIRSGVISDVFTCKGDALEVEFQDDGFVSWNNGTSDSFISSFGEEQIFPNYGVDDCILEGWKIFPDFLDTMKSEAVLHVMDGFYDPCFGQSITVEIEGDIIEWSNENQGNTFESIEEGVVTVLSQNICSEEFTEIIRQNLESTFVVPPSEVPFTEGQELIIDVVSESAEWYSDEGLTINFHTGATYGFNDPIDGETIYIQDRFTEKYSSQVGLLDLGDEAGTPGGNVNASVEFLVSTPLLLKSVDIYTEVAGEREIEIYAADNTFIMNKLHVFAADAVNTVVLDLELAAGSYYVTTNSVLNTQNFGAVGPLFYREKLENVEYPFVDQSGQFRIEGHSFTNQTFYYSFYNWVIEAGEKSCDGYVSPVTFKSTSSLANESDRKVVFNNPASQVLMIEIDGKASLSIVDLSGKVILSRFVSEKVRLDISNIPSGYYSMIIDGVAYKLIIH